jgi:outer membrane protein
MKRLFILLTISLLALGGRSQGSSEDPLSAYLQEGLRSNLSLQNKQLAYQKSRQALREAKGLFFPQLSFNANYTLAGGGRAIEFPVGDLLNPVYQTLNALTAEDKFPTDLENVNELFLPNNFQETKVRIIQPLFNSDILLNYRAKEAMIEVEKSGREAYARELVKEIKTAYYQYLQTAEVIGIFEESRHLLEEVLRVNQRLLASQKATPDAVTRAQHELSKLDQQLVAARKDKQLARAYFNFLLNRDLNAEIVSRKTKSLPLLADSLSAFQQEAVNRRLELLQLQQAQTANAFQQDLYRYRALPRLNLVLDVGFQGFGYKLGEQEFWLGQVALEWDLFKGYQRRAQQEQARIQGQILRREREQLSLQLQLQVQQAYHETRAARASIAAAEQGLQAARQTFRLLQRRYQENQASLLELIDARSQYTQARLSLAIASFAYQQKYAELEWARGGNERMGE